MDLPDSELLPAFPNDRDRVTYLLAKYRIPITITVLAGGVWFAALEPSLPTPTERQQAFATAWGILAVPTYWVGLKIADYLYSEDWAFVGVTDPGEQERYDLRKVPPDLWEEATINGPTPLEPDEGKADYVVTRYQYYEELDELEVRGVPKSGMTPAEATRYETRVDQYYDHYVGVLEAYAKLKSSMAEQATRIHDETLMQMVETREDADMVPGASVTDQIAGIEEQLDDIPNGPMDDLPEQTTVLDEELGDIDDETLEDLYRDQDPELNN